MTTLELVFILLIIYQIKHFLADYILQTDWMLQKGHYWRPLIAHAYVHGIMTMFICVCVSPAWCVILGVFDATIHAFMDRIKSSYKYLGRYGWGGVNLLTSKDTHPRYFWWALGFDQMIHHLTHIACIWWMITHRVL